MTKETDDGVSGHEGSERPYFPDSPGLFVVGIGASAGGLEVLRQMLPTLPTTDNLVYVVVQHLDPKHESVLTSLLEASSSMPVTQVVDGAELTPGQILVTPSGQDVVLEGRALRLYPSAGVGPTPSVDRFLKSIAEALGEQAAGVILSGTGSDGAHGIRAIKGVGGIAFAQTPQSAKYDGMPRSAIDTGCVDLVLDVEEMGAELERLVTSPVLSRVVTEPDAVSRLLRLVQERTGADFSGYKTPTVDRRLARRLTLHRFTNIEEYLAYVEEHPAEIDALTKDLLICVTSFFRDEEAFHALDAVIRRIVEDKGEGASIRVWVPGCATGEEAYSIALLFARALGDRFESTNLSVFGTDIDADAIAHARRGLYPDASLVNVDQDLVQRFFRRKEGGLQAVKSLRERLIFAKQDVIQNPPFSRLDLISCRNLLIYLNAKLQRRLIPLFHYGLLPGGHLFLGKADTIGPFTNLYRTVSKRWRIFRAIEGRPGSTTLLGPAAMRAPSPKTITKTKPSMREIALDAASKLMGTSAVLIDGRQEVVHVVGTAGRFLRFAEGDTGLNILELCPDSIRVSLRAGLHKATREKAMVVSRRLPWIDEDGSACYLTLHISPVSGDMSGDGLTLIAFEVTEAATPRPKPEDDGEWDDRAQRIVELEQDLAANREHLQSTAEELETANEELQSLNEELQSSNEELQSSNEELETTNEELQATHEELSTVNDELRLKSAELSEANSDLENILTRMDIPLVVVDRELRVRHFTPAATMIFHFVRPEQGQAITSVASTTDMGGLGKLLTEVLGGGETRRQIVSGSARQYEMRAVPLVEEAGEIDGVIMTFYDQTEALRREQEFRTLVENAPDVIARFDRQLRHLYVNRTVTKVTGLSPDAFLGRTNRELGMPDALCGPIEEATRDVLRTGVESATVFEYPTEDGIRVFESRLAPERSPAGEVVTVLSVGRDVTRAVMAERASELLASRLREVLESISDGFLTLDSDGVLTFFNQAAAELFDRSPDGVTGSPFFEAIPPLRGTGFEEKVREALTEHTELTFDAQVRVRGEDEWLRAQVYPRRDGVTVLFRVVTDEKRAAVFRREMQAKLLRAGRLEALGTLARGIAHEFNNLLALVVSHTELALDGLNDGPQAELEADLQAILSTCSQGVELINRILAYGRDEQVERQAIDLREVVKRQVALLRRTVPRMVEIILGPPFESAVVTADGGQMGEIVLNLASNAVAAMPEGGELRIELETKAPDAAMRASFPGLRDDAWVVLTVSDTGTGMDATTVDRIFEPFFTTKGVGEGTGLGLSVVYGIVQDHDGVVRCESRPGEGTHFLVALPRSDAAGVERRTLESRPPVTRRGGGQRVLIVDDEELLRRAMSRLLRRHGYEVSTAATGENALALMGEQGGEIDLVLLDLGMPGMGGKACLLALLEDHPETPVVMLTGHAQPQDLEELRGLGAREAISKPVQIASLLSTLGTVLLQRPGADA